MRASELLRIIGRAIEKFEKTGPVVGCHIDINGIYKEPISWDGIKFVPTQELTLREKKRDE